MFADDGPLIREQERAQREDLMWNEISHVSEELNTLGSLFLQSKYSDPFQRIALIKDELYASDYYALGGARNLVRSLLLPTAWWRTS